MSNNIHEGHRERLREKALKNGLNSFSEHEILELMLFNCIARKNTNETAHNLISTFGSITNLLERTPEELKLVKGIGEKASNYLIFLKQFIDFYNQKMILNTTYDGNPEMCVKILRKNSNCNLEKCFAIVLNNQNKIILTKEIGDGDYFSAKINLNTLRNILAISAGKKIIIAHTHPNGDIEPSENDIVSTQKIIEISQMYGVDFSDHIIFNSRKLYSFRNNGRLLMLQLDLKNQSEENKLPGYKFIDRKK